MNAFLIDMIVIIISVFAVISIFLLVGHYIEVKCPKLAKKIAEWLKE